MKIKNYYSLALLSALTVFGCSENDLFEASQNPNNAISFSTQTGKHSRANVIDNENVNAEGNTFGLYGYYTGQDNWNTEDNLVEANFMNDQKVTCSSNIWSYDPLKYWPNSKGDKISFFAYMPKIETVQDGTGNAIVKSKGFSSNQLPIISFTQEVSDPSKMVDFVVAQKLNQTKQTEAVVLPFQHVLTRLNFSARVDKDLRVDGNGDDLKQKIEGNTQVFVTGLRVLGTKNSEGIKTTDASGANSTSRFFSSANYQMSSSTSENEKNGRWDTEQEKGAIHGNRVLDPMELTNILNTNNISSDFNGYPTESSVALEQSSISTSLLKQTNNNKQEYLFLIPPYGKIGIQSPNDIRVQLDYDIVTKDSKLALGYSKTSTSATISLPNGSLKEGTAYNVIITIGMAEVKVAAEVAEWKEESVYGGSTSNTDCIKGLTELNVMKGINPNCNYFIYNNITPTNHDVPKIDLTNWKITDGNNFTFGDQIRFSNEFSTINKETVPFGWSCGNLGHLDVLICNRMYLTSNETSNKSEDILNGIKSLNSLKRNTPSCRKFILTVPGNISENTEITYNENSLNDLTKEEFESIFGNFEINDEIYINSSNNNNIYFRVPTGWVWNNTTGILKKTSKLMVFTRLNYYQWDAYLPYECTLGEWGPTTANTNYKNDNSLASASCKNCPTQEQLLVYLGNNPYWDNGEKGKGQLTYYCYVNEDKQYKAYHAGLWLKKLKLCDSNKALKLRDTTNKNTYEEGKEYNTGSTNGVRNDDDYFFLPATGLYYGDKGIVRPNIEGYYWSATRYDNYYRSVELVFKNEYATVTGTDQVVGGIPMNIE